MEELNFIDRVKKVINEEVLVGSSDEPIGYRYNKNNYLIVDSCRDTFVKITEHKELPPIGILVRKKKCNGYKKKEINYFFEDLNEILETFRLSSIPNIHEFDTYLKNFIMIYIQNDKFIGHITNLAKEGGIRLNVYFTATPEKVRVRSFYRLDLINHDNEDIIPLAKSKGVDVDGCELFKKEDVTLSNLPSITELLDTKIVESIFNGIK